ncbi:uncharacterized protein LOC142327059 isoform X2 [Lycorma delicatula]|uniref:uncharacterized protein LOC142327059 isoform X2 n=1 Tax=Lycorma delicatula TaxID=130591 RepID=UPI003F510C1E
MILNTCCTTFFLVTLKLMFVFSQEVCLLEQLSLDQGINVCSNTECTGSDSCAHWCKVNVTMESPLSVKIIDPDQGKLEVKYKLHDDLRFHKFEISLYVDETATPEKCGTYDAFTRPEVFKLHSMKTVYFDWCDNPNSCSKNCSDTLTVVFDYIFKSCYRISIGRHYKNRISVTPTISCGQMLYTNYKKKLLTDTDMTPYVAPQVHANRTLYVDIDGDGIVSSYYTQIIFYVVPYNNSRTAKCSFYSHKDNEFQCEGRANSSLAKCKLTRENTKEKVNCEFNHVSPGNYCVSIIYEDDRCHVGSIWGDKSCFWTVPITVSELSISSTPVLSPQKPENFVFYLMTTTGLSSFFIIIVIFIFILWQKYFVIKPLIRRTDHGPRRIGENIGFYKLGNPKVFLLYPRDCDSFMEAMSKFRQVLRRANCKVYDIWDPEQYNSLAHCPSSWVHLLISDKLVHVIIVASELSIKLERSFATDSKVTYLYPQCFDDLFLYGYQCLSQSMLTDRSKKMYMVSLRGSQNNNEGSHVLTSLNPTRAFSLPIHLEKLILDLHSVDGCDYGIDLEIPEVIEFEMATAHYSRYRSLNPDYVNGIVQSDNEIAL